MTDPKTLRALAARCRATASRCLTASVARKFEALAGDYEEHARLLERGSVLAREVEAIEPGEAARYGLSAAAASRPAIRPNTKARSTDTALGAVP